MFFIFITIANSITAFLDLIDGIVTYGHKTYLKPFGKINKDFNVKERERNSTCELIFAQTKCATST